MRTGKLLYAMTALILAITAVLGISAFAIPQAPAHSEELQTSPDGKGYRLEQDGWIYVHIEGKPYERGYQYG
jgi:hypothetical protein